MSFLCFKETQAGGGEGHRREKKATEPRVRTLRL